MGEMEIAFLTKVLAISGFVFVVAYLGNLLSFSNQFVNALVTAVIVALVYAGLYYAVDSGMLEGENLNYSREQWIQSAALVAILVFVIDLIANLMSFSNRFVSALVTAVLFGVLFAVTMYATFGIAPPPAVSPA